MKKSTKSTPPSSRKSQTPRVKRHTSGKAKPVTIELTAETVEAKATSNTDSSTKTETAPSRSKSQTGTPAAKASSTEKEKAADNKKPEVKTGNQFGRDSKKESSKGPDPVSGKAKTERAPSTLSLNLNRFAAALIGGCVALGGAGLFQYLGLLASPNSTARFVDQDKYSAETKALREELVALKKLQQAQSQTLQSEIDIAAINERIDSKIAETALQMEAAEIEKIVQQVNETSQRLEELSRLQSAASVSLEALDKSINVGGAGEAPAFASLNDKIESLSDGLNGANKEIEGLKLTGGNHLASSVDSLTQSVSSIQQRMETIDDSSKSSLTDLEQQLDAGMQLLATQAQSIASLQEQLAKPNSSRTVVARAIAAAALKSEIDSGIPFTDSLNVLQKIVPTEDSLTALEPFASKGVTTGAQLYTEFQSLAGSVLGAVDPKPDSDLGSRLIAGVRSFVKVKPRAQLEGSSPIALVSQISAALQAGELQAASGLWQKLPADGQAISKQWHDKLTARITADQLISRTVQSFINSTATQ